MKIRNINSRNKAILENTFLDYLIENGVKLAEFGLVEKGDKYLLLIKLNGHNQITVLEFVKEDCIGYEPAAVAEEILKPILDELIKNQKPHTSM